MKFSEISKEQWMELKPYLDTCLLPVTGLDGNEAPYEATEKLEKLRDVMDLIEIPFKGRVVTYPASHFIESTGRAGKEISGLCANLRNAGFKYVILVSADKSLNLEGANADLVIQPSEDDQRPSPEVVTSSIRELWRQASS